MSYNVVQRIRNNYYLYEVTAEWDPETKRSKQKRRYIGKCDADGNLVRSKDDDIESRNLGEYHLMFEIARSCGLWDALCSVYGEDIAAYVFSNSVCRCIRSCPPTQFPYDVKGSVLPDFFGIPLDSEWLTMSGYLNRIVGVYSRRMDLFRTLCREDEAIVYDIDVLRPPLRFYKMYRDSIHFNFNSFPQKNAFIGVGATSGLPFYLRSANYSGTDRGTMKSISEELSSFGVKKLTFCLTAGDFEESDIRNFLAIGYGTILGILPGSAFAQELISEAESSQGYETVVHHGNVYKYVRLERTFSLNRCDVLVVMNSRERDERTLSFYSKLEQFESTVPQMRWSWDLEDRIASYYGFDDIVGFFELGEKEDGRVSVRRNREAISGAERLFGISIYVSNTGYGIERLLDTVHAVDRYNQDLTIFRVDLQGGGALFPSNESASASIMSDFVGMVMKKALIDRVNASGLDMTYLDVISEASRIKEYRTGGRTVMSPVSAEQRRMFKAIGIDLPTAGARYKGGTEPRDRTAESST